MPRLYVRLRLDRLDFSGDLFSRFLILDRDGNTVDERHQAINKDGYDNTMIVRDLQTAFETGQREALEVMQGLASRTVKAENLYN